MIEGKRRKDVFDKFLVTLKQLQKMISENSVNINEQALKPNSMKILINSSSSSNTPQMLEYYYPTFNLTPQQQLSTNINKKYNKNYTQLFSAGSMPNFNNKNLALQKQIHKKNEKIKIIEEEDVKIEQTEKKKPSFLRSQSSMKQLDCKKQVDLEITLKEQGIRKKKQNTTNNNLTVKKEQFHISKSLMNKSKEQKKNKDASGWARATEVPRNYEIYNHLSRKRRNSGQGNKEQLLFHKNKTGKLKNQMVSLFFSPKHHQFLPTPFHFSSKSKNKSCKIPNNNNNKSASNLLTTEKQKPSFIPTKKSMHRFHFIRLISRTQFSDIYLCMDKKSNSIYCVKKIKKSLVNENSQILDKFVNNINLRFKSSHPNIIQLYDLFSDNDFVYLIEEYMEGKSLKDFFNEQKDKKILDHQEEKKRQSKIVQKMYNLNSALLYIHQELSNKLTSERKFTLRIHGDMRSQQILMNLGTCKISPVNPTKAEQAMNPNYFSPQVLQERQDMWNLGLILFQLCANHPLFKKKEFNLTDKITHFDINKQIFCIPYISWSLKQLMKSLLKIRPDERINAQEVMKSNVIKIYGVRSNEINLKKSKVDPHIQVDNFKQDRLKNNHRQQLLTVKNPKMEWMV